MLKTPVKYLCSSLLILLAANGAEAQLLKGLKDRVVNTIERRVEQNVEQRVMQEVDQTAGAAVDQSFATIFGDNAQNADGTAAPSILSRMTDTSNIKTESEYRFDIATTFEMESFDSKGKSSGKSEMVFHYSADAPYTGTRIVSGEGANTGAAMMIYDFNNSVMLMLMESEGSRFAMAYNWDMAVAGLDATPNPADVPSFERIGSRNIGGYNCEGYRTTDGDLVSEVWVTNEIASGMERIFQANRSMPMLKNNLPGDYPQGMLMEVNSENTKSGEKFQMRTKDIDTNSRATFRMSDYPMMSLGAFGGMGQ